MLLYEYFIQIYDYYFLPGYFPLFTEYDVKLTTNRKKIKVVNSHFTYFPEITSS